MMMNFTAARNQSQLRGPRPPPLTVNKSSTNIFKKSTKNPNQRNRRSPIIIYLRSPKIIHVRPEEFKSFVQRLTGNRSSVAVVASSCSASGMITDHSGEEFASACNCIPS
ncbi:protein MKS1-like [Cucumis melo var. makuwa]|uniref:Protein MKS1-like n=2 Tax=Cucumis melo TaxID=3656 RepID=A0A5D3DP92_CUCMM|nr:protein MKS1-like [Cucumis melo var. makuwa]TYK25355.1 protein MKS1-like [Cucumis melo var. makuwa]